MSTKLPIITILGNVESRQQQTKNGPRTVYEQKASVETEAMRIQTTVEVDGPNLAYRVGQQLEWDVVADLQPGQYGRFELARKRTLRPYEAEPAVRAVASK